MCPVFVFSDAVLIRVFLNQVSVNLLRRDARDADIRRLSIEVLGLLCPADVGVVGLAPVTAGDDDRPAEVGSKFLQNLEQPRIRFAGAA